MCKGLFGAMGGRFRMDAKGSDGFNTLQEKLMEEELDNI